MGTHYSHTDLLVFLLVEGSACLTQKMALGAGGVVQWVEALAVESNNLSLMPHLHTVGENELLKVSSDLYICTAAHERLTHTHTNQL